MSPSSCSGAHRSARTTAIVLIVSVVATLLASIVPAAAAPASAAPTAPVTARPATEPAPTGRTDVVAATGSAAQTGMLYHTQEDAAPEGLTCLQNTLHSHVAFPQCNGLDLVQSVKVNDQIVTAGTKLKVGDVVTAVVEVPARGDWDAFYKETGDGLWSNTDWEERVRVKLPAQTGTVLSDPEGIFMLREDKGHRGPYPGINCIFQMGEERSRFDQASVTLGAAPAGELGRTASLRDGYLVGTWTTPWVDRCVDATSFNGVYAGHYLSFTQRVLARPTSQQTLTWSLGGPAVGLKSEPAYDLTWGDYTDMSLVIDSPPSVPRNVTAAPADGGVDVSFRLPDSDGGTSLDGVEIQREGGSTRSYDLATSTTQFFPRGDNPNASRYRVRAYNAIGNGPWSAWSGSVAPGTDPAPVWDVVATPGNGRALVTFGHQSYEYDGVDNVEVSVYQDGAYQATWIYSPSDAQPLTIYGLTNGTSYQFSVQLRSPVGSSEESERSPAVTIGAPTAPPTDVVVAPRASGAIRVTWTPPTATGSGPLNGAQVRIFSRDGTLLRTATSAGTSFATVTGLTPGQRYVVKVRSRNAYGLGPETPAFSPQVTAGTPPTTPEITSVTPNLADGTRVDVAFTSAEIQGLPLVCCGTISAYDSTGALVETESVVGSPGTINNLTPGQPYTFTVTVRNASGESAPSLAAGPVTPAWVPAAPTVTSAVPSPSGPGAIDLEWTPPEWTGDGPITGSRIKAIRDGAVVATQVWDDDIPDGTIVGLTPQTDYTYTVAVRNAYGWGAESPAFGPIPALGAPAAPRVDVVSPAGSGAVTVYWTAPTDDGGRPITRYEIVPVVNGIDRAPVQTTDASTSTVVSGLRTGTRYTFRVRARNDLYWGDWSSPSEPNTPNPTAPKAPRSVTAAAGVGTVTVTWSPPASDGGAGVRNYKITPYLGTVAQASEWADATMTERTFEALPGLPYTFQVTATNWVGDSPASKRTAAVTPTAGPGAPQPPGTVRAVAGDASAVVSWTAPDLGCCPLDHYLVLPVENGVVRAGRAVTTTATSATVTGLTNGTAYRFRVVALTSAGSSNASALSPAATPSPPTVPGVPTTTTVTAGAQSATVRWRAPASDGRSPITGYRVTPVKDGVDQAPVVFTTASVGQTLGGLTAGSSYRFRVAAVNAVGTGPDSAPSAAVTPTAPSGPPGAPTIGTVAPLDGAASVSWTAPANPGGSAVTSYRVVPYVAGAAQPAWEFPAAATTRTITALTNGTTYRFKVAAINASGVGPLSALSAPVTPVAAVNTPGAPTGVTATPADAAAVVSWTPPANPGTTAVSGYRIVPFIGTTAQPAWEFNAATTTRTITGLTNGTAYTFTVTAVNSWGYGAPSTASDPVTPSAPGSVAPEEETVDTGTGTGTGPALSASRASPGAP